MLKKYGHWKKDTSPQTEKQILVYAGLWEKYAQATFAR